MERIWFIYAGTQQEGPLTLPEVRARIDAGQLKGDHLAWREGLANWTRVADAEELRAFLAKPPELPRAAPPPLPAAAPPATLAPAAPLSIQPSGPFYAEPAPTQETPPNALMPRLAPERTLERTLEHPTEHTAEIEEPSLELHAFTGGPGGHLPAPPSGAPYAQLVREPDTGLIPAAPAPFASPFRDEITQTSPGIPAPPAVAAKPVRQEEELSQLIDLRLGELEERTATYDVKKLRQIEKEAQKTETEARRAGDSFERELTREEKRARKRRSWAAIFVFLVVGVGVGTGIGLGYQWALQNLPFFAVLGETPGAAPEERAELEAAARAPLNEGGRAAIVVVANPPEFPSFYVAANLPDGANLDVYVHGIPDSLVTQAPFETVLKAQLTGHLAKTEPLRGPGGIPAPAGRYTIIAVESNDQPEPARAALANLRPQSSLPSLVPQDRRIFAQKTLPLLQGKSDEAYRTELKAAVEHQLQQRGSEESAALNDLATGLAAQLAALKAAGAAPQAAALEQQKAQWDAFGATIKPRLDALVPTGASPVSGATRPELVTLGQDAYSAFAAIFAPIGKPETGTEPPFGEKLSQAEGKLAELKTKLDASVSVPGQGNTPPVTAPASPAATTPPRS